MESSFVRKRSVKACTEDKQVKLRCDANNTFPQPCARCSKRGLVCVIDSTFKRTPTRLRLQSVTNELRQLKESLHSQANDDGSKTNDTSEDAVALPGQQWVKLPAKDPFGLRDDESCLLHLREARLENCEFDQNNIRTLFLFFYRVLHPHLPVVDTKMHAQHIRESSPFLFWTIIFLASRYHEDYISRSNLLMAAYMNLVNRMMLKTPHSLHTIQAILLLSTWPLPLVHQLEDPTVMYAGIAVHASFMLGLPRAINSTAPTFAAVAQGHRETMAKTWLACFSVHTSSSMYMGVPPLLRTAHELATIDKIAERSFVPPKLAVEAEIQRSVAKYHDAMLGDMDGSVRETLVQMCDRELDNIPQRLSCSLDAYLTFSFVMGRLHIYTLALLKEGQSLANKRRFDPHSRGATYQTLGMAAAIRIIDLYCTGFETPLTPAEGGLINRYSSLPKNYFRGVLFATFFLLKYYALNKSAPEEDKSSARNKVLMVHAKLRAVSSHQSSEPGRAATVIEVLCRHADSGNSSLEIEVEDRASASVAWGALILASKLRGRKNLYKAVIENTDPFSHDTSHEDNQAALPGEGTALDGPGSVPSEENMPLPEDLWDQSFLDLLDFRAYDFDADLGQPVDWLGSVS